VDPNDCYKLTFFFPNSEREVWTAAPDDPEEPKESVMLADGTRQEQKRSGINLAFELGAVELRRCYSRKSSTTQPPVIGTVMHKAFFVVGVPYIMERVQKPDWWGTRDGSETRPE
jgi:hypothetical protein